MRSLLFGVLATVLISTSVQASAQAQSAEFSTYLGGAGADASLAIAVDRLGFVYVAGYTDSLDFPATTVLMGPRGQGNGEISVTKFDPSGRRIIWSTLIAGTGSDVVADIAVDGQGAIYLVGNTTSKDFPTTAGSLSPGFRGGNYDGFITKLSPNGTRLIYSTYIGGTSDDLITGLALGAGGIVYGVGFTSSFDLQVTPGAFDITFNDRRSLGGSDAFVVKLEAGGSSLIYGTYIGGTEGDFGQKIALDETGAVYLTGQTFSGDYPITPGGFDTSLAQGDAFVTKLDPSGSQVLYSTYLGGDEGPEAGYGIGVDRTGAVYVFGTTLSGDFPMATGVYYQGSLDLFVAKLNPTGTDLVWAQYLGGTKDEYGFDLTLDRRGNVFLTGQTFSSEFPITANAPYPTPLGSYDLFATQFTPEGVIAYSTFYGTSGYDTGFGMAVSPDGYLFLAGSGGADDLPTSRGAYDRTYNFGTGDGVITKILLP